MGLLKDEDLPKEGVQAKPKADALSKKVHIMPGRRTARATAEATDQSSVPASENSGPLENEESAISSSDVLDPSIPDLPAMPGKDQAASVESVDLTGEKTSRSIKGLRPRQKSSVFEMASRKKTRLFPDKGLFRRAAWDISAILSLLVNTILLVVIGILAFHIHNLKGTINNLVGGLYNNFVALDNSVISTTLSVPNVSIPLDFSLPVNQPSTNVTLTEDVTVRNAYVVINTGPLNINSAATITLPRGTTLPVSMNMVVPVQTSVLVNLSVPVVIKLSESNPAGDQQVGLHDAFLGLQNTLGPYYCLFNPDIVAEGIYDCQQGEYLPKPVNP